MTNSGAEAAAISVDHVEVRRTAIVARCGPVGAPHGWMVLHGIHQRAADFIAPWTRVAGAAQRRVLAPEGLSRTILDFEKDTAGACWTTIPDRPIDLADTYAFLDLCHARLEREAGAGARVLVGFSQGSIIAARWATARAHVWDAVVLWGGALPSGVDPHALAARSRDDKLHFVIGSRDHLATAERRAKLEAAMRAAGVATDVVVFEGGHRLDDATLEALAARHEG